MSKDTQKENWEVPVGYKNHMVMQLEKEAKEELIQKINVIKELINTSWFSTKDVWWELRKIPDVKTPEPGDLSIQLQTLVYYGLLKMKSFSRGRKKFKVMENNFVALKESLSVANKEK